MTCCQHFFPPMLKAAVKVLNDDRCGPNNSLVPPSEIAETGVGVFRKLLSVDDFRAQGVFRHGRDVESDDGRRGSPQSVFRSGTRNAVLDRKFDVAAGVDQSTKSMIVPTSSSSFRCHSPIIRTDSTEATSSWLSRCRFVRFSASNGYRRTEAAEYRPRKSQMS